MKNKGFTLTELLAVIVILGVISVIATTSLLKTRNEAETKEYEQVVNSIKDLGPDVYLEIGQTSRKISLSTLVKMGFLKTDKVLGKTCSEAYLIIHDSSYSDMFDVYLRCPDYQIGDNNLKNYQEYVK